MSKADFEAWADDVRTLLAELAGQDLGYESGTNEVRLAAAAEAAVPDALRPLYAAFDGVDMPDVHVGYFIDTAQRVASAAERGEPVQIVSDNLQPIHVFGSDGGGGRFALSINDQTVYYLPSSGAVKEGKFIEDGLVRVRRIAGSVEEFLDLLKADVQAFVHGVEEHRYIVG